MHQKTYREVSRQKMPFGLEGGNHFQLRQFGEKAYQSRHLVFPGPTREDLSSKPIIASGWQDTDPTRYKQMFINFCREYIESGEDSNDFLEHLRYLGFY